MIPITLFNVLLAVEVLLVLYSLIDIRNKYYGNILTMFIASLLGFFLSVVISTGVVEYNTPYLTSYVYNESTLGWAASSTLGSPLAVQDPGTGFIILLFAIGAMIYSALMIYDAYLEWKMVKQEDENL